LKENSLTKLRTESEVISENIGTTNEN